MFDKLQSSTALSWEESEAPLYIMSCVASHLSPDENKIVPNVIQAIVSTPGIIHSALKYTGVRLISQLNNWIAKNDRQILSRISIFSKFLKQDFALESVLHYLLSLLVDEELRYIAAETILTISQQCRKQLVDDLDQIIQATLYLEQLDNGNEAIQCLLKGYCLTCSTVKHHKNFL